VATECLDFASFSKALLAVFFGFLVTKHYVCFSRDEWTRSWMVPSLVETIHAFTGDYDSCFDLPGFIKCFAYVQLRCRLLLITGF
jgi:hypothetical protein